MVFAAFSAAASLPPPEVTIAATKSVTGVTFGTTAYARVRVHSNGSLYSYGGSSSSSGGSAYEVWLDAGNNDQVWVECTIVSGTLNHVNAGTGSRLICSSLRTWGISTSSSKTTVIDLDFYDAESGGNLLDSQRVGLDAEDLG